jgi:hypothetical protein
VTFTGERIIEGDRKGTQLIKADCLTDMRPCSHRNTNIADISGSRALAASRAAEEKGSWAFYR